MQNQLDSVPPATGASASGVLTRWLELAAPLFRSPGVRLRHLHTCRDIARVAHLRDHIDLSLHRGIDPDFELHEKQRDDLGFTVGFEVDGQLIGTIRAVPMRYGLTLTERLLNNSLTDHGFDLSHDWEMGRLVLDPRFRAGPELLRHCMYLALSFLERKARVDTLHASCTPVLARLYRRLGFEVLAQDVPLEGTPKTYTLIKGPFSRVLDALSADKELPPTWRPAQGAFPYPIQHEVFP